MKKDMMIHKIISRTNNKFPDSEIYLYGSRAHGKPKKLSDWDLLVLLDQEQVSFEAETKLMDEFYELELETGEIISPLIYSKKEWLSNHSFTSLFENIQKEGIRIK